MPVWTKNNYFRTGDGRFCVLLYPVDLRRTVGDAGPYKVMGDS